ncbi:ser/Thr phosphatase family protein [Clostridium sp. CAG:167]|nr:ser/Thr phosphatase family protein [Clostridium sp. CAG:167]
MKRMNKVIAFSALAALTLGANSIQAGAYGETTEKSTLTADTKGVADYQTWKENTWTGKQSIDSGKIALTPGATEKDLNFCWYSTDKGTPQIKVGKKADLSDGKVYTGTVTDINRSNSSTSYKASNKVSIKGIFEKNSTYYYSYTIDGKTWSTPAKYETKDVSKYKILLVGDPQVGASGSEGQGTIDDVNIAVDTYNWNKTLEKAEEKDGDASFILSVGDQIDYSAEDSKDTKNVRESEYAGFLYPSILRNLPLATSIGNHESKGTDYKFHYNNPNTEDNLGATQSGSDYYFSYGNVLYIILNSNNRNAAEHSQLMEKAIKSHPDAKWKVVAFHHDIYGSGQPHSDFDGANLRTIFAPLMDKYDIDVCLTGHDHSYARTYQIIDGTAIDYGEKEAVDPEGTLYIAAGSASGSKFYNLATQKQYYIAERSNNQLPTYSTIDFTDSQFTIKTYDYEGNEYAKPFSIKKNGKETAADLIKKAKGLSSSVYSEESLKKVQEAVDALNAIIASTSQDKGAAKLSAIYDKTNNGDNDKDPLNYYGYAQGEYASRLGETKTTTLRPGFSSLLDRTSLPDLTTTIQAAKYDAAYNALKTAIANVQYKVVSSFEGDDLDLSDDTTPTTVVKKTAAKKVTLTIKKGKKALAGKTIKLKKGKGFKIKATKKNTTKKITYKSSNKKAVKVSASGKVTVLKYAKKKVTITVKVGTVKKTFSVKVIK